MSSDVVELRVHGISGMRAEDILDRPVVVRVAGDDRAGFYRPRPGFGDTPGPAGVTLEAYRWGGLTADRAARTLLLLLLLPFMFSNVAVWLRPNTGRRGVSAVGVLCYLLAASITAMFVLSIVGASMDLVGWQCAPYRSCVADRRYLSWLSPIPVGPRLALLAVVPVLAIRFVWWIGARSARSYEGFRRASEEPGQPTTGPGRPGGRRRADGLDAPGFWYGEAIVHRLRAIHVGFAFGVVDLSLLAALVTPRWTVVGGVLVAAAAAHLVAGLALLCRPALSTARKPIGPDAGTRAYSIATAGLTVLSVVYAAVPRPAGPVRGGLPGYSIAVSGVIVAQAAILAALVVVVLAGRRDSGTPRAVFQSLGTPVFGYIAVGLTAILASALVYRVADFLDRGRLPSPNRVLPAGQAPLEPPVSYRWAALSGISAVLAVTLAVLARSRLARSRRRIAAERIADVDFPHAPGKARERLGAVRDAILKSRMPEQLAPFVVVFFALSLLSLVFTALDLAGVGPTRLSGRIGGPGRALVGITAYLTDVGTYSLGLLVLGAGLIGLLAFRSAEIRRIVGTLWDLGTFWPRSVHPFAPPCYAERAVPELVRRITSLSRVGGVVVSGHSQGSVLAAAAILQLPPQTLRRVSLLTYGSPLHRLYSRLSPAYFGDSVLCEMGDRVGWRWRNLWRDTDPVGGPVFSAYPKTEPPGRVDRRLRDPRGLTIDPMDTVPPPIDGHWSYHTDPAFAAAIAELITFDSSHGV